MALARSKTRKTYTIEIDYELSDGISTEEKNALIERHELRMKSGYPEQVGAQGERIILVSFAGV